MQFMPHLGNILGTERQFFSFLLLTTGFETTKHKLNVFYSNLSKKPAELFGFPSVKSSEWHYGYKLRDKV